jgi:methylmalonyl-CoA/ethylmalonyl-CoA epimerase
MSLNLGVLDQIALPSHDIDAAEAFYENVLGLRKLFRPQPSMVFFDCAGVRLMISIPEGGMGQGGCVLYFNVPDIAAAEADLKAKGVAIEIGAHLVAPMPDHDLWMTFFRDPDQNFLALSSRAPKGYKLPA